MEPKHNLPRVTSAALARLEEAGVLCDVVHLQDGFAVCGKPQSWASVAQKLSELVPYRVWVAASGLTVVSGRSTFYLQQDHFRSKSDLSVPAIMSAREIAAQLGITSTGYSLGNIARKIVAELGPRDNRGDAWRDFRHGDAWGCIHAEPGAWGNCTLYDVKSCYFELLRRLPTPYPIACRGRLGFGMPKGFSKARFREVTDAIAGHKHLRNNVVGCMVGAVDKQPRYAQGGKFFRQNLGTGHLASGGMLIIRSEWEMCRIAAMEGNSVHTAIDSVICTDGNAPRVWQKRGLTVRAQYTGDTDIKAWAAYKVGEKRSELYREHFPYFLPTELPAAPPVSYHEQWL